MKGKGEGIKLNPLLTPITVMLCEEYQTNGPAFAFILSPFSFRFRR